MNYHRVREDVITIKTQIHNNLCLSVLISG